MQTKPRHHIVSQMSVRFPTKATYFVLVAVFVLEQTTIIGVSRFPLVFLETVTLAISGTGFFVGHMFSQSPNQRCQNTHGNTKQWHKPVARRHAFFIHYFTPHGWRAARSISALQHQYLTSLPCKQCKKDMEDKPWGKLAISSHAVSVTGGGSGGSNFTCV